MIILVFSRDAESFSLSLKKIHSRFLEILDIKMKFTYKLVVF